MGTVNDPPLNDDYLEQYFVAPSALTQEIAGEFQSLLDQGCHENEAQKFLEAHPQILAQYSGHTSTYVVPQKRLGSEFVTDFLVGELNSGGMFWCAFELESPRAKAFNQNGDPSRALVHANRQITDWRAWLATNADYASKPRSKGGLGLEDINSHVSGKIVIGRRQDLRAETRARRRQYQSDSCIDIMSYDRLLD